MLTERNLYASVVQSLTRFVEEARLELMPNGTLINWDGHATINELPEGDLIGLAGVGMSEDSPREYEVVFGILASTWDDENLYRLTQIVSDLRGRLVPETRLGVFTLSPDGLQAVEKSWMVAALPLAVTPVQKAEVRAVQGVECRLLLDPGATSSLRRA